MILFTVKNKEEMIFVTNISKAIKDEDNVKVAIALRELFPQSSNIYKKLSRVFDIEGMKKRGFLVTERVEIEDAVKEIYRVLNRKGEHVKYILYLSRIKESLKSYAKKGDSIIGISCRKSNFLIDVNDEFSIATFKEKPEIAFELKV